MDSEEAKTPMRRVLQVALRKMRGEAIAAFTDQLVTMLIGSQAVTRVAAWFHPAPEEVALCAKLYWLHDVTLNPDHRDVGRATAYILALQTIIANPRAFARACVLGLLSEDTVARVLYLRPGESAPRIGALVVGAALRGAYHAGFSRAGGYPAEDELLKERNISWQVVRRLFLALYPGVGEPNTESMLGRVSEGLLRLSIRVDGPPPEGLLRAYDDHALEPLVQPAYHSLRHEAWAEAARALFLHGFSKATVGMIAEVVGGVPGDHAADCAPRVPDPGTTFQDASRAALEGRAAGKEHSAGHTVHAWALRHALAPQGLTVAFEKEEDGTSHRETLGIRRFQTPSTFFASERPTHSHPYSHQARATMPNLEDVVHSLSVAHNEEPFAIERRPSLLSASRHRVSTAFERLRTSSYVPIPSVREHATGLHKTEMHVEDMVSNEFHKNPAQFAISFVSAISRLGETFPGIGYSLSGTSSRSATGTPIGVEAAHRAGTTAVSLARLHWEDHSPEAFMHAFRTIVSHLPSAVRPEAWSHIATVLQA
jgi:hypothetical protein